MFESKSPIVRIGAYIIIGFFTLIIVISFGMPDFMTKLGMDDNVVAVINGEKIYRLDFVRYRDSMARQMPNTDKKEMQEMILSNLIMRRLILQKANDIGIKVSDERVNTNIKNFFKDPTGKFNKEYLNRYLDHYHQAFSDFFHMIKEDLIINEFRQMIFLGTGVSPEEIRADYSMDNSRFQIQYCFLSNVDLNNRFKDKISVTENEIDKELQNSKDEIKDPKTDRTRVKEKLEKRKLNILKNELIAKIDKLTDEKRSFAEAMSYLGGKVFFSNMFKAGDAVKEANDNGKIVYALNNSPVFNESFLLLGIGRTSKVVDSFDGLYVFTPVKNDFKLRDPSAKEYEKMENELLYQKNNSVFMSVMSSIRDKSKIIRNLKFN